MIEKKQLLPPFTLKNQDGVYLQNSDLIGKWWVLYLYPKDLTPGCTTEAIDFTALNNEFKAINCEIYGLSPDSTESHCKFISKKALSIQLLSDPDHQFIESLGFWQLKKFLGKQYMGVVRATLIIDPQGIVQEIWPDVKVKEHAQDVLDTVKGMLITLS